MSKPFETGLAKITNTFAPMIESQLMSNGVNMDQYAKQCVINAISAINTVLDSKVIDWNDPQLDRNNITQILLNVASLKLNAAASPREVFFQLRNVKVKGAESKEIWKKQIEMGIEGDGNDAILSNFGRNVAKVYPYWLVRDQDHFVYPKYRGVEYEPPEWSPTGRGEVVRIVYPILHTDKSLHYYISERDDVVKNLIAHINNNMMNETFGICQDRFKATADQRKKIAAKKSEVLKRAKDLGIGALDDPDLQQYISPAWSEYHSRESMLIRKMRNNVVKKIPKDFGSAFVEMLHDEVNDPDFAEVRREISENANSEPIDIPSTPQTPKEDAPTAPPPAAKPDQNPPESEGSPESGGPPADDFSGDVPPIEQEMDF
ncbi:hypothetical protein KIH86_23105 [Paenibacillus sp. HN-1]|uniref:hypothetical protein n=1 Tax=Paenibacillus TaxID=44249 RepID=UPI001CA8AD31|nr:MULTISPECIES: hypothetical protein [Paenibacillus]MBY9081045.1 hypothetical protein [Paenibacillus sp. CGMCC 1.18879]MBY9087082.1 hypothetical protein [Paenibacillus sinensis]